MNESIKYNQDIKFDFDILNAIKKEAELIKDKSIKHSEILNFLLDQIKEVDFRELAELKAEKDNVGKKHFLICSIEQILETAQINNWGICKYLSFVYLYNGAYWRLFDNSELQEFLGKASEKMGVDKFDARHYQFREQLYKQFLAVSNLPKPNQEYDTVLINLKNGTFEISPHKQFLRPSKKEDFLTYQLPFEYNPDAKAPIFCEYLNKVQPDIKRQNILAEYLAYIFIKTSFLKLEKTLLLYGSGANGKSVFFEIVNAMLGSENISCFSLQNLTNENGYYRAMLSNKLLNYSSEINGKLETSIFKQLVSGEPVDARLPYGDPFTISDYAKLIFNCNELPKDVEQTDAFFRRFLIIPFDTIIPENEQDKELSKKIIINELSGVFNWILDGLNRLLCQRNFTQSEVVNKQLEEYRKQSDSVLIFLDDENYEKSNDKYILFKELFNSYLSYCNESNYRPCSTRNFSKRLQNAGFETERKNFGIIVFINKC
jgi:putative DNA primase/helicase